MLGCSPIELDDAIGLTVMVSDVLADASTGMNGRHALAGLLRQSVLGRLAGYEDVNDAERLRHDPAMRWIVVQDVRGQRRAAPTLCARLQSRNFLRTLATPEPIKDWSLTSLKEKLIKIGAKVVSHGAMSPSKWPRSPSHGKCSRRICGSSRNCGRSHHQRWRKTFDGHAFKSNKSEECVPTSGKIAR
jgi:Transposase DDE domain group 1